MKKTIATICAAAVAVTSLGVALSAQAASPVPTPQLTEVAMHHRAPPRVVMQHNYPYLNGHRGDRHWHSGWRSYGGYWFPPAAFIGLFIGGAIIGNMLSHAY